MGTTVSWVAEPYSGSYALTRGDLPALTGGRYGPCLDAAIPTVSYVDNDAPAAGAGFVYLIQGVNAGCGAGTLGRDSALAERVNGDPAACFP